VNKLIRDCVGSSMVEFTVVFPLLALIALGTVDVGFMLSDWAEANKAAYVGAHKAILSDPVAVGITDPTYDPSLMGDLCFDRSTGKVDPTVNCPTVQVTCTPSAAVGAGVCTTGTYSDTSFANIIFPAMQAVYPELQRQNVTITYQTNNLGFVGRPDGLPMNVTVSIQGMKHQFFFLGGLMNAFGSGFASVSNIPRFATTLPSEDMTTN
jgi:Flp pilus assembly protein TadG